VVGEGHGNGMRGKVMARNRKKLRAKMDPANRSDNKRHACEEPHVIALGRPGGANQWTLRDEAVEVFVNAILNPPIANKAARMAAARYEKDMGR
jgi:hypothetical protein